MHRSIVAVWVGWLCWLGVGLAQGAEQGPKAATPPGRTEQKPLAAAAVAEQAYVEKVVDGDTMEVRLLPGGEVVKIRVLGIDCPESHQNQKCESDGKNGRQGCDWQIPRGLVAARRVAEILKQKVVGLECDGGCKQDVFGRLLRYLRLKDGQDFGLRLVGDGLCEDFGWKYPHPRRQQYRLAQDDAKKKKLGIWATAGGG